MIGAARCCRVLFAAVLALVSGCLVIPVDYHASGSRHNVNAEVQPKLQPGVTTKEEVFLLFGEPDYVSEDGKRLGYKWSKVKALFVWGGYYSASVQEMQKTYLLYVTFDADDRVEQTGIASAWGTATPTESGAPPHK